MPIDPEVLALGPRLEQAILAPMKTSFVGKDEIVDLLGVALAAGENLFLLGPPGTAKSALVHELARRLAARSFDYLLTRFTEPNELFGPFDIRRLREGELLTNTEGMLPEAELVFLDELLNANSSILNSLLTVLNERVFRRGRETRPLPTLAVIGASNRLPEDEALGALFDRFLLRVQCLNVDEDRLSDVLGAGWQLESRELSAAPALGADDVRRLQGALGQVALDAVREPLVALIRKLRSAGLAVSDRRAVKLQRLVAASALLCGRGRALISDLWVVRYVWDTEEQVEVLQALVTSALTGSQGEDGAHPRARGDERPDPEVLARDLDLLERRLDTADEAGRAVLRDRLAALAARSQWVREEPQRGQLQDRIDALWKQVGAT